MTTNIPDEDRQAVTSREIRSTPMSFQLGKITEMAPSSIQAGDGTYGADLASNEYDRLIATAKTATGSPIGYRRELREDDLVTLQGMDVQVSVARSMGLITADNRPNPDAISDVLNPNTGSDTADLQPSTEEGLSEEAEGELGSLIAGTSGTDQVAALSEMIETGEVSEGTLFRAASQLGVEPGQLAARVEAVRSAFAAQADQTVARLGITDTASFWSWAHEKATDSLREAMKEQGMARTTDGYVKLAHDYHASLDTVMPEALLSAELEDGVEVTKRNGKILVRVDGREMAWKTAIRTGLISVTG